METQLATLLDSKVEIERVTVGLFNTIELHKVKVYDKKGKTLLNSKLIYGKVKILPLLKGQIFLRNISILDANINLYRERKEEAANFQFILDAFKSKDKKSKGLNLTINSLLLRRCQVAYHEHYSPTPQTHRFSPHHVELDHIDANLSLKVLTNDSLNLRVRNITLHERSGWNIRQLRCLVAANRQQATVNDFVLRMPNSHIHQHVLRASYSFANDKKFDWQSLQLSEQLDDIRLGLADLTPVLPQCEKIKDIYSLRMHVTCTGQALNVRDLDISNETASLSYQGNFAAVRNPDKGLSFNSQTHKLVVQQSFMQDLFHDVLGKNYPSALAALGTLELAGDFSLSHPAQTEKPHAAPLDKISLDYDLGSELGELQLSGQLDGHAAKLALSSEHFTLSPLGGATLPTLKRFDWQSEGQLTTQNIAGEDHLGIARFTSELKISDIGINHLNLSNVLAKIEFNDGTIQMVTATDDPALRMQTISDIDLNTDILWLDKLQNSMKAFQTLRASIDLEHLHPRRLHLTDRYGDESISLQAEAAMSGSEIASLTCNIGLTDFQLTGGDTPYSIDRIDIGLRPTTEGNHLSVRSDFADLDYNGTVNWRELQQMAQNLYSSIRNVSERDNAVSQEMMITDAVSDSPRSSFALVLKDEKFFQRILKLNIGFDHPIQAQGSATLDGQDMTLSCLLPDFSVGKFQIQDCSVFSTSSEGDFDLLAKLKKSSKNGELHAELKADNAAGTFNTKISWDESLHHRYHGNIVTTTELRENGFTTEFLPTDICIADTIWNVSNSTISYENGEVRIRDFGIYNLWQSLEVNGNYTRASNDTIVVALDNLDLEYVLAFANIGNDVDFGGHATGDIYLCQHSDGTPWAKALLDVPDFLFNKTAFGCADVTLEWDHKGNGLLITGDIVEAGVGNTRVNGYVDILGKKLDLQTHSLNTPLGFLNKYTTDILEDISGHATGDCRIYGTTGRNGKISFEGHETAEGAFTIPYTGVTYRLEDADVAITQEAFRINNGVLRDQQQGVGSVKGALTHDHMKDMSYDILLEGNNLLVYDLPYDMTMPFYATAYGTGNVHLYGSPGHLNVDVHIDTEDKTELTYLLDASEATATQMLTIQDAALTEHVAQTPSAHEAREVVQTTTPAAAPPTTDIQLNFEVNVTNRSTLHLVTDAKSGDVITVSGYGPIQASYHNLRGFQMFGTYNVERGTYGLNVPMLAQRKKFDILSGGQVQFSGDPMEAEVNVKARYVVNSVSLSDLSVGNFTNKTTRANCLIDIYGEVANMQFNLDFELPNCSVEEQQMIHSLIASEEEKTVQVLYLLGIGRFYSLSSNAPLASESSSMVNSLISSTLSSQLNNIISDAIGSTNWSFGTNISTGQLGWSDMEMSGQVSSRLLNNRLLLNGNFGYSERRASTPSFIGDFDAQYLITPSGSVSIRAYSETNDRYFTKSSLTTQGIGVQLKRDFTRFRDIFRRRSKNKNKK